MAETKVIVRNNGPYRIEGDNIVITDEAGQTYSLAGRTVISLCRCGQSANKPFCDGSHNRIGFNDVVNARELPPPTPKFGATEFLSGNTGCSQESSKILPNSSHCDPNKVTLL